MGAEQAGQQKLVHQDRLPPPAIGARAYRVATMLRDRAGTLAEGLHTQHSLREPRLRPGIAVLMQGGKQYDLSTTEFIPLEGELDPGQMSVRLEEKDPNGKPPIVIVVTSYFSGNGRSGEFYGGDVLVSGGDNPLLLNSTQAFDRIEADFKLTGE